MLGGSGSRMRDMPTDWPPPARYSAYGRRLCHYDVLTATDMSSHRVGVLTLHTVQYHRLHQWKMGSSEWPLSWPIGTRRNRDNGMVTAAEAPRYVVS
jgi:hypothetical protein